MKPVKYAFIVVVSFLLICGLILVGCQVFDQSDSGSPTAPGADSGGFNYWGQKGKEGGEFTIFVREDRHYVFSVNVPENDQRKPAEGYALWYRVYRTTKKQSYAYVLYFRALEEATLCIGLLSERHLGEGGFDVLEHVEISYEHYDPEARLPEQHEQGPVEMYAFPGEWLHWDEPEGGARVPAPDDPPEDIVFYSYSEGKTQNTMENRCGGPPQTPSTTSTSTSTTSTSTSTTSTSTTSASTSTTSTTTTTTTTTTTEPSGGDSEDVVGSDLRFSCPPPSPFNQNRYISVCDDTTNGPGDQATASGNCDGGPDKDGFSTGAGNAGVKAINENSDNDLLCIPWTSQSGTWSSGQWIRVEPGDDVTLEGSYNVALECWCE